MPIVFRWLARWPLGLLHGLGGAIGWATFWLSPTYRRRFVANARQAGVPWRVARRAVAEAGRLVAELPWLWLRPPERPLSDRVQWLGAEAIDAAHAADRGVVFLTPHLGSFEATAQAYAERYAPGRRITVLYRPARKPALRELVDVLRGREGLAAAPATLAGVRRLLRALRRGEAVGLLPDQVPPAGLGVWAPFFGRPAYTMTLAARLVQQTDAVPLLVWGERLARGAGWRIRVEPLGEALPADPAESAAAINRAMEQLIARCPEQYLWGYHRYKAPRTDPGTSPVTDSGTDES